MALVRSGHERSRGTAEPDRTVRAPITSIDGLTRREREVASAAAAGLANREIGTLLGIAGRTVENHLQSVYKKFGMTSRQQLIDVVRAPTSSPAAVELGHQVLRPLSVREREVGALVAEGLSDKEIAGRLRVSIRTAQGHVAQLRTKLHCGSRGQVAWWFNCGPGRYTGNSASSI